MKQSTIDKYVSLFKEIKESGKSILKYCKDNNIKYYTISGNMSNLRQMSDRSEDEEQLLSLYDSLKKTNKKEVDTDDRAKIWEERDENGKIKYYCFEIYIRDKSPLVGKFTTTDMESIYRMYSFYGSSLTQRQVSRLFPEYSLVDFKRILRSFNITKASSPFPKHMLEEYSSEQLQEIQLREKENDFLRKIEQSRLKDTENLLNKYAKENYELKKQLENISSFEVDVPDIQDKIIIKKNNNSDISINLYLSDIHLGAAVQTGSLYDENLNYGYEEAKRRLTKVLESLASFGCYDTINIVLLGDNIDCPGFFGRTARMDHEIPENMDPREQANKYIELMTWFVDSIVSSKLTNNINMYSVPCGNHAGNFEYITNKALLAILNGKYGINTTMWEQYYGIFECCNHRFICCHGRDDKFCKRCLPLNLDDKSKVLIYEWLDEHEVPNDLPIHFIKGDLHSNNMNSCKRFTYRNVLSLFGASDYSNYNFSRNSYGVSYDLLVNGQLVSGTFENI